MYIHSFRLHPETIVGQSLPEVSIQFLIQVLLRLALGK